MNVEEADVRFPETVRSERDAVPVIFPEKLPPVIERVPLVISERRLFIARERESATPETLDPPRLS